MDGPSVIAIAVGATALTVFAAVSAARQRRDRLDQAWRSAAEALGLRCRSEGGLGVDGRLGELVVTVEPAKVPRPKATVTRFVVDGRGAFDAGIVLSPAAPGEQRLPYQKKDVQLEEEGFDEAVHVEGPEEMLLAALNRPARLAVLELVGIGGRVEQGTVRCEVLGIVSEASQIVDRVRFLLDVAQALRVPSVEAALQRNAKEEKDPGVRRRNLEALARHHVGRPSTSSAFAEALEDPAVENRFYAATVLAACPEARKVLEDIFDDPPESGGGAGLLTSYFLSSPRGHALAKLTERYPWKDVRGRALRALEGPDDLAKVVAVAAAGRAKDAELLHAHPELGSHWNDNVGCAYAKALAEADGAAAEPALIQMLGSKVPRVRVEVAGLLEKVGTVRAVEPLLIFADLAHEAPSFQAAARSAIRAIQARLGPVEAGAVSVVEPRAGEGGLSLGDEKDGE